MKELRSHKARFAGVVSSGDPLSTLVGSASLFVYPAISRRFHASGKPEGVQLNDLGISSLWSFGHTRSGSLSHFSNLIHADEDWFPALPRRAIVRYIGDPGDMEQRLTPPTRRSEAAAQR